MKNLIKILAIAVVGFICSGCVTYIALSNRTHRTPAYCYDCHAYPGWVRIYTSCDYYVIKTSGHGYYYRPRHARHYRLVYRGYNQKVVRERQQKHLEFIDSHKDNKKKQEKREDNSKKIKRVRS